MPEIDVNSVAQISSALVIALIAIAVGLQSILKNWKSNNTEGSLLTLMHTELERMSLQNSLLSSEIGKLQIELINLSSQLIELTVENKKLQTEVASLNAEISRIHGVMVSNTLIKESI